MRIIDLFLTMALVMGCACMARAGEDTEIDWNKARDLLQRSQRGEKLEPADQAYLDLAKQIRAQQHGNGGDASGKAPDAPAPKATTGLIPLTDLGAEKYKGEEGGLYGGGNNEPPAEQRAAAEKALKLVRPLDKEGKPDDAGKVVLLAVGMSNTTMEFSRFKELADADKEKAPQLVIVDGAQGGKAAAQWAAKDSPVWETVSQRLKTAGVTSAQVQVAWIKQAEIQPRGSLQEHGKKQQEDLTVIVNLLKTRFANLRVVYLSSRIYAGYATSNLNPEPFAYEGAFVVRWLIQAQMKADPKLNFDSDKGAVTAPVLLWGPYLWADGTTPRKGDELIWERKDLSDKDGTHPSQSGREKVAQLLLKFFKTNALAKSWYLAPAAP